jgi:hypothetical protein
MEQHYENVLLHLASPTIGNDVRWLVRELAALAGVARVAPGSRASNLLSIDYDPALVSMRTLLARARRRWTGVRSVGMQRRRAISRRVHAANGLRGAALAPIMA